MKILFLKEKKFLLLCLSLSLTAPLGFLSCQLAGLNPALTEQIYSQGIYPFFAQFFSLLTGILPISFSELLLFLLPALLILQLVRLIMKRTNFLRCISGFLALCCCLYAIFSLGWAVNYDRLPYANIAGLKMEKSSTAELESMLAELAVNANGYRAALSEDSSAFKPEDSVRETLKLVPDAYENAARLYPWLGGNYAAPKPAMLSLPLAYLNIAGIYSPFTFEAHVNSLESSLLLPATACHEAAHLRGFAREDEANYIAYVVCTNSGNLRFAYSGTLLALIHAGNALYSADREAYNRVHATYSDGVVADLRAYSANWAPYEGEAAEMQEKVNDSYLKFNGQSDGVRSYGRMVDLLLAAERQAEGADAP